MNRHSSFPAARFPLSGSKTAGVASPLRESVAAPATFPVRIARAAGEAFDADQYGWSCEDCGRDEYGCECELPDNDWPVLTDFPGGAKLTIEEVQDRISRVFLGVSR